MARGLWQLLVIQLAVSGASGPNAHAATEPDTAHLALVIGNGGYSGMPAIPGCVASAHAVTAALQRAGYTVKEVVDESNGRLGAAVGDFQDTLAAAADGTAVLYACGYAVGFDGRVFFLPVSARLERPTDALTQGLVGKILVGAVVRSKVRAGLVVLDTMTPPGSDRSPLASLVDEKAMGSTGFVATASTTAPPEGPSPVATAVSLAFTQPDVELKATVRAFRSTLSGPAATGLVVYEPEQPASLAGRLPPPAVTAAPAAALPGVAVSAAPAVLSQGERRRVQLALQRLGYFHGRVNGTIGADSAAAIRTYQAEAGVAPTGQLTADQLTHLLEDGR